MLEAQGTLYYKVLLQYYKVLLQSYKVLLQYYQVLLQYWLRQHGSSDSSTTKYYILYHKVLLQSHIQWHLQCAGQEVTQYCACPAKSLARLILVAYDVIYNARSSKIDPTSPNTTPATQNESKHFVIRVTYETSFTLRRASKVTLQPHQRNSEAQDFSRNSLCFLQLKDDSRIIRGHSEQKIVISHPLLRRPYPSDLGDAFVFNQTHFALRLSPKMSRHAAPATKSHTPTSPNTAPATQNESKHWSAWHMKRHLHCAEQAKSPSNLTKYCACHEILKLKISAETPWSASADRKTIRRNPRITRFDAMIVLRHVTWCTYLLCPAIGWNVMSRA